MRILTLPMAACGLLVATSFSNPIGSLVVTSPAFANNGPIPIKYTCSGQEFSPPLNVASIPDNAKSLVVIVYDPDGVVHHEVAAAPPAKPVAKKKGSRKKPAPVPAAAKTCDPAGNCFVYWMMWNVDVNTTSIPENFKNEDEGINSANLVGYKGLCAASGTHYYHFKVYALDTKLNIDKRCTKQLLEKYMQGHVLATGELVGSFNRSYK